MKCSVFIRRVFAGLLLLLFVLSNMPKQTLHSFFANHKDDCSKTTKKDPSATQLLKAGIHCQCDNLVVENPFVHSNVPIFLYTPIYYKVKKFTFKEAFHSFAKELPALRGPPSLT